MGFAIVHHLDVLAVDIHGLAWIFWVRSRYDFISAGLGDGQGSDVLGHLVVAFLRSAVPGQGVGVLAVSYLGLRSGGLEGCSLAIYKAFNAAFCSQRGSVIFLGVVRCGNFQFCRCHLDGSIDVSNVQFVGNIFPCCIYDYQGICLGNDVLCGHIRCSCLGCGFLQGVAIRQFGGRNLCAVSGSVIDELSSGGGHSDLLIVFIYGQGSQVFAYGVVAFLRGAIPGQGVRVLTGSYLSLGSGGLEGCGLTIHKAFNAAFCSQCGSIIGLGGCRRGHLQLSRVHLDGSIDVFDVQFVGNILALCIFNHQSVCSGLNGCRCHIRCGCAGCCGFNRVSGGKSGHFYGSAVSGSVIGELSASGGHYDLIGGFCNGQGSDALAYGVVAFLRSAVPGQFIGVQVASYGCSGSGGLEGCGLVVHKTCDGSRSGQRRSVINLACARCGDFQLRRSDGQGSVYDLEYNVTVVLVGVGEVLCLQLHLIGAGIGSFCLCISAEGEVFLGIFLIIDADVISFYGLCCSGIGLAVTVLRNGYCDLILDRIDGQGTRSVGHCIVSRNACDNCLVFLRTL